MVDVPKQKNAAPYRYYHIKDAVAGFGFGMVVNICGIHIALPHEHPLSPDFMNGIYHVWPGTLSVHLVVVQIFSALAVAMAMSANRSVRTGGSETINVFPPRPEMFQRVALTFLPVISVIVAAMSWGFLMGSETPMWPEFFSKMFPGGATPAASWSVWVVAFYASAATASVLSAYQVQAQPLQQNDQS